MYENMNEFRCPTCNKLLFKYRLKGAMTIEIKCTRCGNFSKSNIDNLGKSI